jgi:hypothetical protein
MIGTGLEATTETPHNTETRYVPFDFSREIIDLEYQGKEIHCLVTPDPENPDQLLFSCAVDSEDLEDAVQHTISYATFAQPYVSIPLDEHGLKLAIQWLSANRNLRIKVASQKIS